MFVSFHEPSHEDILAVVSDLPSTSLQANAFVPRVVDFSFRDVQFVAVQTCGEGGGVVKRDVRGLLI